VRKRGGAYFDIYPGTGEKKVSIIEDEKMLDLNFIIWCVNNVLKARKWEYLSP
jgi:hypothetical protein